MPSFARIGCLIAGLMLAAFARGAPQDQAPCPEIQPVQSICFQGNTVLSSADLLGVIGMRAEEPLSAKILSDAVNRIQGAYSDRGYIADFVYYEI